MNKIVLYIILTIAGVGLIVGGYKAWKAEVQREAQSQVTIKQLQAAIDQTNKTNDQLIQLMKSADEIRLQLQQDLATIQNRNDEIEKSVIEPGQDRPSSNVLKDTVKELSK